MKNRSIKYINSAFNAAMWSAATASIGFVAIYGSAFDASLFMTNALNEKYRAYTAGLYEQAGAEFGVISEPKMWDARVKYNFQ